MLSTLAAASIRYFLTQLALRSIATSSWLCGSAGNGEHADALAGPIRS
jgi:hypothetical protein